MDEIPKGRLSFAVSSRGFTIVELLIVIVVIGILAALVLNSFSGVQAKARDAERDTDVKALSTQLEAFYNTDGQNSYPNSGYADNTVSGSSSAFVNILNDSDTTAKLKGIDLNTLRAPTKTSNSIFFAVNNSVPTVSTTGVPGGAKAGTSWYYYQPLIPSGGRCTLETQTCKSFNIYYVKEGEPTTLVMKSSLNQ